MTNVTFTAFETSHTIPLYGIRPSKYDDSKRMARRYATCYRNYFGVDNWLYFETREDAETNVRDTISSPLNHCFGLDYEPKIVLVEGVLA